MNDLNEGSETSMRRIDTDASIQEGIIKLYGKQFEYNPSVGTGTFNGQRIPHMWFPTLDRFLGATRSYNKYPNHAKDVLGAAMYMFQFELGTPVLASQNGVEKKPEKGDEDIEQKFIDAHKDLCQVDALTEKERFNYLLKDQFRANDLFPRLEAMDIVKKTFFLVFKQSYRDWRGSLEGRITPEAE